MGSCGTPCQVGVKVIEVIIGLVCYVLLTVFGIIPFDGPDFLEQFHLKLFTVAIYSLGCIGATFVISLVGFLTICAKAPTKDMAMMMCCALLSGVAGGLYLNYFNNIKPHHRQFWEDNDISAGIGIGALQLINAVVYFVDVILLYMNQE